MFIARWIVLVIFGKNAALTYNIQFEYCNNNNFPTVMLTGPPLSLSQSLPAVLVTLIFLFKNLGDDNSLLIEVVWELFEIYTQHDPDQTTESSIYHLISTMTGPSNFIIDISTAHENICLTHDNYKIVKEFAQYVNAAVDISDICALDIDKLYSFKTLSDSFISGTVKVTCLKCCARISYWRFRLYLILAFILHGKSANFPREQLVKALSVALVAWDIVAVHL